MQLESQKVAIKREPNILLIVINSILKFIKSFNTIKSRM
jgi:hypothetical protein